MGCIYKDSDGVCTMGVKESLDGCIYEDDPDPSDSCASYESDYVCSECGIDLNVEDCECN